MSHFLTLLSFARFQEGAFTVGRWRRLARPARRRHGRPIPGLVVAAKRIRLILPSACRQTPTYMAMSNDTYFSADIFAGYASPIYADTGGGRQLLAGRAVIAAGR